MSLTRFNMYKVVSLTEEYIKSLVELEQICFDEPWTEGMFLSDIKNEHTVYYAVIDADKVIAYVGMWITVDEGQITNVAVHPDYRRKGIAKSLLKKLYDVCLQNKLESITLEVRESNVKAIALYKNEGFENVGLRKNYYKNPTENAILMTKAFCHEGEK